jgi:hypothetical protein
MVLLLQQWDAARVDPSCEQMGREAVTQQRGIHGLGELGGVARLVADMGDAQAGNGLGDAVSGKEPGLELRELPIAPEQREQGRGAQHQAIRRGAKVLGELGDVAQIAMDRVGRVVADLHVCTHTLP